MCRNDAQADVRDRIAEIMKIIEGSEQDLAASLLKTLDVLGDHEERLQRLEGLDSAHSIDLLENLAQRVEGLADSVKRESARAAFFQLCKDLDVEPPEGHA
jgi:hypothetical protein